ncbi:MAG TPA: alpha/beta fold hydrolase [Candidatus Saccharimonadia bacterium]|nr:alpha/beta fold hydrolase [Candidatus Saccharimonadia bacterium]
MSAPNEFPAEPSRFVLPGPAGAIEVATHVPAPADARNAVALICHPHPLHGGTMQNKVVSMVERALRELGLATLKFNFRGVGASEGTHDEGEGETRDVVALAGWLERVRPGHALVLAGFSFGAYVALRAAAHVPVRQLVLVAPPVDRYGFRELAPPPCPWLVVIGEVDEVVKPDAVYGWVASMPQGTAPKLVRMPATSHFFHGKLMDLRGVVKNGVREQLPLPA